MNNRIKELREREGLSQTQLAEKINASQQSISQWENHLKEVPMDIVVALSDYFHVTIDYLMCRTNQYCYDDKQFSELNQEIAQLSIRDQRLIKTLIKSMLEENKK
ncbi:MAG: helix-turn-helix transcriptional regulator [Coprobacillus cateniformis]|uniref:helix-turn-helix domain-containing protein n=1 Tax=Longibaculum muris TaxID=1796628 RepID=UPI003AB14AEF|nr:helix-turn-helix transcriptional regulator [Coprobacillus cateniformis]